MGKEIQLNVGIPEELDQKLEQFCHNNGSKKKFVVTNALKIYLFKNRG